MTLYDLLKMLAAWQEQSVKPAAGEISKEDYDRWRYYYPKYDTTRISKKNNSPKTPLVVLPTAKGVILWIFTFIQAA